MRNARFAAVCVWLASALHGCSTPVADDPIVLSKPQTYIGALDDGDVRIAIVLAGTELEAYVCGKDDTLESHTRWFSGSLDTTSAGEISVEDWTLRIHAGDAALRGELVPPHGDAQTWSADAIEDDASSEVGLYAATVSHCRSGVIVWQAVEGPDCEAQGAWCDASGVRGQVTPLNCTADDPLSVQGERDGKKFNFIATRVLAP